MTLTPGDHGLASAVADSSHSYASSLMYGPMGMVTGAVYGLTGSFTGIVQSNSYNSRLQPSVLSAAAPAGTLLNLMYDFGLGTNDNGNVYHVWNEKVTDHSRDQAFTYDGLNRLATAQSGTWGVQLNLDAWGNVVGTGGIAGTSLANPMPLPVDLSANGSNQPASSLVSYTFTGGNLTSDGTHIYSYDAASRLAAVDSTSYTYNGDGERVQKSSGTLYWGPGPLAESDASGNIASEYVFVKGKRLARRDVATGNVYYYLSDQLGSSNVVTDATGNIQNESDFYPYGGENAIASGLANQRFKFTGKERDSESGLDNFGARYYNSGMGRWMSPDWSVQIEPVPYAKLDNPQSLNLYVYVGNNPASMVDPDGHLAIVGSGIAAQWARNGYSMANPFESSFTAEEEQYNEDVEAEAGSVTAVQQKELQKATSAQQQSLSYKPVKGNKGDNTDRIRWNLSQKSKAGGYIVQEVTISDQSGNTVLDGSGNPLHYSEAFQVEKNKKTTIYNNSDFDQDDIFFAPRAGYTFNATARFYEGLTLPSSFSKGNVGAAGYLPSTYGSPGLPTDNATAPVNRTWTSPGAGTP